MLLEFKKQIVKYTDSLNERIVVSISGGLDSVVLFDLLIKLNYKKLILVHFNYNIHTNSTLAQNYINKISKKYNLKLFIYNERIGKNNFESIARLNRYRKLNKIAKINNSNMILTAHHYDDQLETLIMKDKTKSDWVSYIGIREKYDKVLRPMLKFNKKQILAYAKKNNLIWFEDETNNDLKHQRNKVRYNIKNNIYKTSYFNLLWHKQKESKIKMTSFNKYMSKNSKYVYSKKHDYILFSKNLNKYFNGVYLKLFLKKIASDFLSCSFELSKSHWDQINSFVLKQKHGTKVIMNNLILMCDRDGFIFYNKENKKQQDKRLLNQNLLWYDTSFIIGNNNAEKKQILDVFKCPNELIGEGVYLTHWNKGDFVMLNNTKKKKKVKDIFTNNKLSLFDKKFYPIIKNSDSKIIWIPKMQYEKYNCRPLTSIYWVKNG